MHALLCTCAKPLFTVYVLGKDVQRGRSHTSKQTQQPMAEYWYW